MAKKRGRGSSTRKSSRKSARGARRATSKRPAGQSRRKRGVALTKQVTRTAKRVLFGGLGVVGYVRDTARRGRSQSSAPPAVKPIPDGYHTVTPYLIARNAPRLIEFVQQAFGATERMRSLHPDGSVMHAEVIVGDSPVMISDASASFPAMPACIHIYAVDADALYHLALQAGATSLQEPTNQFYGDRMAGVQDPVGNHWWIATHVEDVSPHELSLRAALKGGAT